MGRRPNHLLALAFEKEISFQQSAVLGGPPTCSDSATLHSGKVGTMPSEKAYPIVNKVFDGIMSTGLL